MCKHVVAFFQYVFVVLFVSLMNNGNANEMDVSISERNANVNFVREIEGIREFRLSNGLQVLLINDVHRFSTTINLVYKTGSAQESYGQKGIAHLLEHLIYTGGISRPDLNAQYRQRNIPTMGNTSFDFTSYRSNSDASQQSIDWVLGNEAEHMSKFNYSEENLKTVLREVIGEKETTDASGHNSLVRRAEAPLFFWSAYGKDPIGNVNDLNNVTLRDIHRFWENYYRPDNASLIISGKFNEKDLLRSVAKTLGRIQNNSPAIKYVYTMEPTQDGEREIVVRRKRAAGALMVAYRTEPIMHPDAPAAMLLGLIFGSSEFGRLQNTLIKTKIAKRAEGYVNYMGHEGAILFGVDQEYGLPVDEAKSKLLRTMENVKNQPITQAELDQAKQSLNKDYLQSELDTEGMTTILSNFIGSGDWRLYFLLRQRMEGMNLATLQRIAESWFSPTNRSLCILKEDENMVLRPTGMTLNLEEQLDGLETKQIKLLAQ